MREVMESSGRGHRDGVEITSIGVLYRGPFEKKYWSSSRGKEKYPYPIGYQATRWHGGHCYFMEVLEGPRGPSFVVKCEEGITCSGQTPSVAWDDILKKKHAGAKRVLIRSSSTSIDGAEMFGFTNPLVQRLCRDLVVSASGAAENSHSLPDEEVKDGKEVAAEGARRKAGSLSESSEKSPVKARRGKKSIQSPSNKYVGDGAEEKEKNAKQRVASQVAEEESEIKETRKQKLKSPATERLERSQDVKIVERTQVNTRKDNTIALHSHPEEEEMPRSKRSKLPKPKVGPHADEDTEHVGASQTVSSANSKRVKSLPFGTKRMKGEERSEGHMSKYSGHGTSGVSPHGIPDGYTQNDSPTPFVKCTQDSAGADYHNEVPMSRMTASSPSQITCASDLANVDEVSQRNASSRTKRMKLAKSQKILDSVKPEKYDTEVDLTQSEGFLSIDLMCPSAEDMRKQTSAGPSCNKCEDVSSKQDGYLMLLAACKVAEVEQSITKEKTGAADIKRKRPMSDVDSSSKAATPAPEVVSFPTKERRVSVGDVVGVKELASSSDLLSEDESPRNLAPPGKRLDTDSTPGKLDLSDRRIILEMPHGDELLTVLQSQEDVISHENQENMDVSGGADEKVQVLHKSNSEGKMERYLDKSFVKEEESGSSHDTSERPIRADQVHGNNAQTVGRVNSRVKSLELPVENLLLHEQVSKNLEATRSVVHQKDATKGNEGLISGEAKFGLKVSSPLENGGNNSQSGELSTALTDGSATCAVVSSDAVLRKENVSECDLNVQNDIDSGQVDPHGAISTARKGTPSPQALRSLVRAKAVENTNSLQPKVCEAVLGTTCGLQIPAGAVCHDDLSCKELQGLRSLTTAVTEKQETSLQSKSGRAGINQSVHSANIVDGSAAVSKVGCFESAADEPCSTVTKVNHTETGAPETSPTQLPVEVQPAHSVTATTNVKSNLDMSSQGLGQHSVVTVLETSHHVHVDTPMRSPSQTNFSSVSQCDECPPECLKQPSESLPAAFERTPAVCFGAEFTKLENGSSKSEDENGMVNGASPKNNMNLPKDFAAEALSTSTSLGVSQAVDLAAQSKALLRRTSEEDMGIPAVFIDPVELDLCVPAYTSTPSTTHQLLPAQVGPVKGTESGVELNLGSCCQSRVNTVLSSDQRVDLATSSLLGKGTQVLGLDGCKEAVDNPETQSKVSSYTTLDLGRLSSVTPVDTTESVMRGANGKSKEDKVQELVPETVEAVKDSGSGAKFENGNLSDSGSATVITSEEIVLVPICIVSQEQVFDSKSCTDSLDPSVENPDFALADRVAPVVLEKLTSAPVEAEKGTGVSTELALSNDDPDVVTACSPSLKVSSSEDILIQGDRGLQVLDVEVSPKNAESPLLLNHQAGSAPSNCRGDDEEQKPGATGEGELVDQEKAWIPALFPGNIDAEKTRSCQIVDSLNFQLSEPEEIRQPTFISGSKQSTNNVTTSVTTGSPKDGVLEEKHVQVDACTTSSRDVILVGAVSPVPSQSALSENQSQRSESDSAGRELTTSVITLLLPEALPFVAYRKRVEKKEMSLVGDDVPSKTGDIDVGASVSLVGSRYRPSEHPAQADLLPRILEAGRLASGEFVVCNESRTVGFELQLRAVNDSETGGGSSVQASGGGCRLWIDAKVNAGNQISSSNGNVQEITVSSEASHPQVNVSCGIGANLEEGKPCEFHAESSSALRIKGKGNKSEHLSQEFSRGDTLPESAEDCEIFQPLPSTGAMNSDLCQDNPKDSLEVIELQFSPDEGLRTSRDISSSKEAAQVQREAQLCAKVVDFGLKDISTCTTADRRIELTHEQAAGCNKSLTTALGTNSNQESNRVASAPSELGVAVVTSSNSGVEDEVSLVDHAEAQFVERINYKNQDVGQGQGDYLEGFERCADPMLDDTTLSHSLPSTKLDTTAAYSQDAQFHLLPFDASCGYFDHSEDNLLAAAVTDMSEEVKHANPESSLCPQLSPSRTQIDESFRIQTSHFQKMELPISIEHPTKVSTMVVNVRGEEIRLCVCCGTGSERTLSVFKIIYTEGAHLEHQLLTVLETSYKNLYCEEEKMKLVSEESGLSFTPDGQQLILLHCFELRHSSTDTHDGRGVKIVSLDESLSSTRLESEGTLLCLAVREPQRLIVAGEDGHINFWDMDASWRSFEKFSLPKATVDGVPFTSVTSLLVVPHLQHMVVGCNPSGFFALWDLDSGTLLYSCQMFDNLLLKTSLVDLKSMNWEPPLLSKESVTNDTPARSARKETPESLAALPLICLLTMVASKERCSLENKEDVLSFKEQKPRGSEGQPSGPPEVNPRGSDADLLNSRDSSSDSNGRTPQHQPVDTRNFEYLEQREQEPGGEVEESTSTGPSKSESKIPGPWDCKTVLMRGGHIVCGHALSDRPTSITSMGRYGVMGTADGLVHLWDVENGRKLVQLDDLQGSAVVSLATSSSLAVLATAGENKRVNLYLQKDIFAEASKKTS